MKKEVIYRYEAMHLGVPVIMDGMSETPAIDVKYRGTGWLLDLATWFYFIFAKDGEPFRFDRVRPLAKPITRSFETEDDYNGF